MKIELPQVGESVTEAIIDRWLKAVGDRIEKYEPLAEVVTDKVSMEMPSPVDGVVTNLLVEAGSTVPMGTPIAEIEVDGEEPSGEIRSVQPTAATFDRIGTLDKSATNVGPTGSGGPITTGTEPSTPLRNNRYSPAVLRLAELHNVDLAKVGGTGINGRITRQDVQAYVDGQADHAQIVPEGDERVPLTAVRRMIAENMTRSATEIPEAWMTQEVDMTNVMSAREQSKNEFSRREGAPLTPLAFALKAVAEALRANPLVNSTWGGDAIVLKSRVNVCVAIASPKGLLVPVVHDADQLSIRELAKAINTLAVKARDGKLGVEDVQGGTFTVNNTGALGSTIGKGIINHPQAAILNTEAIVKKPVVVGDGIAIRSMMNLCLTFDHRILDGAEAGSFVADVKRHLEAVDPDQQA